MTCGLTHLPGLLYLHGVTDYGDSVEDEWLIVYTLREISKKFPNLWVRVFDSDGEFLLVEAANVLPKWLSPEIDANRAWIHQGQLRIIPLKSEPGAKSKNMTLPEAVEVLKADQDSLVHSAFLEAEAFYRLDKYPGQIQESIHCAQVTIPRRLAYIIHEIPKAIAPAVEAFYLRNPVALKRLMLTSPDSLTFPPQYLVTVSVRFTKVLYAQLKSQQFSAPPAWLNLLEASEKEASSGGESQKKHSMLELGMKVTCGFEMLAVGAGKSNNRTSREVALLLDDLAEDGDQVLPTDSQIKSWKDVDRDDDDSWMDINFEDFEKELNGKRGSTKGPSFGGDTNTQVDLRKMVSRFEAFLNDEKAGIDGAEFDEMDEDDDDDDDEDDTDDDDSEDFEISFDEEEFARMMREMMGLPAGSSEKANQSNAKAAEQEQDTHDDHDSEEEEIRKMAEQMEAELNEHGALALDPIPKKLKALKGKGKEPATTESSKQANTHDDEDDDEIEDEEVDIDYNLAKNLLESFKGQAGMVGPVGTMLADMGIRLPRDEDEESDHGLGPSK